MTKKNMQVNLEKQPVTKADSRSEKAEVTKAESKSEMVKAESRSEKRPSEKTKAKQPAKTVTVKVDKITSGSAKDGVFGFNYRGKLIDNALFPLLEANEHYGSKHHIDNGNLLAYQNRSGIFPYSKSEKGESPVDEHNHLTLSSWAELMKYYLARSIQKGDFDATGTAPDGTQVRVKVEWAGEEVTVPEVRYQKPAVKRDKKPTQDLLDGLSF